MRVKELNFMSLLWPIKFACFLSLFTGVRCSGVQCRTKVTFIYNFYDGHAYSAKHLDKVFENENFDPQKPTTIFSYGFLQTPFVPSVRAVVDAYLKNSNYNFMVTSCDSIIAYTVFGADEISDDIVEGLSKIYAKGYRKFHLVGFSFGAQLAGLVGRKIQKHGYKIPRITGLDPGKLMPFFGITIANLSPNDAEFVDVIHAETKYFGAIEATGHANFWINGGKVQPMCKHSFDLLESVCSHLMTLTFWVESVKSNSTKIYQSKQCTSYKDFLEKKCDAATTVSMGISTDIQSRGNFYLQTNLESPYSMD